MCYWGMVPIRPVAAYLFTLGQGLAAASAVRIAPDGSQTPVAVTLCAGPICNSVANDLSGAPVYLSVYGRGFGLVSAASSSCAIAGQGLPVTYVGPQGQVDGVDQVNMLLPETLAGAGETSIACSFGAEATTNAVRLTIR